MAGHLLRVATGRTTGWWEAPLFAAEQRATLVNAKVKLVKDRVLDGAVLRQRHLRSAHHLLDLVSTRPGHRISCPELLADKSVHKLFGSADAVLAFLRRYCTLFKLSRRGGGGVSLTDEALDLRHREVDCLNALEPDLLARLRRLLMLTLPRSIPLHTVDLLRWDLGLPRDYRASVIHCHPDHFALAQPEGDERVWLRLLSWDDRLAVSELEKGAAGCDTTCLPFPVSFTRGFGLRSKCMDWLREWQALPYTNPYADASGLDRRTDVSEKRNVGVFHELLHLTLAKRTERHNVSNMRKLLGMPQKFTKVFERHPGIFYLSRVLGTQTVVLREAYGGGGQLLEKNTHPLVAIRKEYTTMMRAALPPRRSRESRSSLILSSLNAVMLVSSENGCSATAMVQQFLTWKAAPGPNHWSVVWSLDDQQLPLTLPAPYLGGRRCWKLLIDPLPRLEITETRRSELPPDRHNHCGCPIFGTELSAHPEWMAVLHEGQKPQPLPKAWLHL